jgi:hypothetical protein
LVDFFAPVFLPEVFRVGIDGPPYQ